MRYCLAITLLLNSLFSQGQNVELLVLGVAQDAGYPQASCSRLCCADVENPSFATSLAVIVDSSYYLFEATPDVKIQLRAVNDTLKNSVQRLPDAMFLTHAHMGHYTGLLHWGREVMGSNRQVVHCMPKMSEFLHENGPWNQLVNLENIEIRELTEGKEVIYPGIRVQPILVPHRDEFSETVGYLIEGPKKKVLFIPDIDKWEKWNQSLVDWLKSVDYAFIDGTFMENGEIPNRDMSEIPHPFVVETMSLLESASAQEKAKVHFIHFNHTNPILWDIEKREEVVKKGFNVAFEGLRVKL